MESAFLLTALIGVVCLAVASARAGTFTSTNTGNYDADATWYEAGNPDNGSADDVTILSGHTVTVLNSADPANDTNIINGGMLVIPAATYGTTTFGSGRSNGTLKVTGAVTFQAPYVGRGVLSIISDSFYRLDFDNNNPTKTGGISMDLNGTATSDCYPGVFNPFGNNRLNLTDFRMRPNNMSSLYVREFAGGINWEGNEFQGSGGIIYLSAIQDAQSTDYWGNADRPVHKYGPAKQTWTRTTDHLIGSTPRVYSGEMHQQNSFGVANPYVYGDGTLTLEYSKAGDNEILGEWTYMNGGTLRLIGRASAAVADTTKGLNPADGLASTIRMEPGSSGSLEIRWGDNDATAWNRNAGMGAQVNFTWSSGTFGLAGNNPRVRDDNLHDSPNGGCILGTPTAALTGAFGNGVDLLKDGGDFYEAFAVGDYAAGFNGNANEHARLTGDTSLAGAQAADTVKLDAGASAIGVDLDSNTLTLGNGIAPGIILKIGTGTGSVSNGTITLAGGTAGNKDLLIRVDDGQLELSTAVNMANTAIIAKSGPGLLTVAPTAAWTVAAGDSIAVCEGPVRFDPAAIFESGSTYGAVNMTLAGGVLELTANFSSPPGLGTGQGNVQWNANAGGGFSAYGGARSVQVSAGGSVVWNTTASFVKNGGALKLSSTTADNSIDFTDNIDLGSTANEMWFREVYVEDNTNSSSDEAVLSGQITGGNQYHLVKSGPGELTLSNANNTFLGVAHVYAGTLAVDGTISAPATASPDIIEVLTNGTLTGTGTINRDVEVDVGGILATPSGSSDTLTIGDDAFVDGTLRGDGGKVAVTATIELGSSSEINVPSASGMVLRHRTVRHAQWHVRDDQHPVRLDA